MKNRHLAGLLLLSLSLWCVAAGAYAALAAARARERNWADQIIDFVMVGEPVWLEASGVKFLALYTLPENEAAGPSKAVILMHGRGVHPAWGFIDSLRMDLANMGWHTLSLQMPVLARDAAAAGYGKTFPAAFARIEAGIRYLRQREVSPLFLLGHSLGATMGITYLTDHPQATVDGMVAIGAATTAGGTVHQHSARMLEKIRKLVLDIYGSDDLPIVLDYAEARRDAARKARNQRYLQIREPDTDHFFTDNYDALRDRIYGWLRATTTK